MKYIWIWFSLGLIVSCSQEADEINVDQVSDYYPIDFTHYSIYDVNQINYDLTGADTSYYQLKEEFIDSVVSSSGMISFILQRSVRQDTTQSWKVDSIWSARYQASGLIIVENNTPYQKLAFPLIEGTQWDGNAYNSLANQTYYYKNVDIEDHNEFINAQSLEVIIEDIPRDFVKQDERSEVYTKGIGLVEKNYIALDFCTTCGEAGIINAGFILEQVLIEHGQK